MGQTNLLKLMDFIDDKHTVESEWTAYIMWIFKF